jgi:hypothetical protein
MSDQPNMKTCKKCNTPKPLTEFGKKPRNKDGLAGQCKECIKAVKDEWQRKNRDKGKQYAAKYRATHKEKLKKDNAAYNKQETARAQAERKQWRLDSVKKQREEAYGPDPVPQVMPWDRNKIGDV